VEYYDEAGSTESLHIYQKPSTPLASIPEGLSSSNIEGEGYEDNDWGHEDLEPDSAGHEKKRVFDSMYDSDLTQHVMMSRERRNSLSDDIKGEYCCSDYCY
jgi:hypothetical protein